MNWGKWIVVAFALFAAFIATLVTVCMREEVDLVSKDYYKEELAYQEQIVRMNNVNQLPGKPAIQTSGDFLLIYFAQFQHIESGTLRLFSPSDPKKDKVFSLKRTEQTEQSIPIHGVAKGMYRAQMQWVMNGKEYFIEEVVNI